MTLKAPSGIPAGEVEVVVTLRDSDSDTRAVETLDRDTVVLLETNIDDMNPEIYGYLIERLLSSGAKDAYLTPIIMKKGRPAIKISVLADEAEVDRIAHILMQETTTLGIRTFRGDRYKLPRTTTSVNTSFGPLRMKTTERNGHRHSTPEFDDCERIAVEKGVPILEVYAEARRAWEELEGNRS